MIHFIINGKEEYINISYNWRWRHLNSKRLHRLHHILFWWEIIWAFWFLGSFAIAKHPQISPQSSVSNANMFCRPAQTLGNGRANSPCSIAIVKDRLVVLLAVYPQKKVYWLHYNTCPCVICEQDFHQMGENKKPKGPKSKVHKYWEATI